GHVHITQRDPIKSMLQAKVDAAVSKFDAMGDDGFTLDQKIAMKKESYLREMYRGYNIDRMVRVAVSEDRELKGRIEGQINNGVDFRDKITGKEYEMTTTGAFGKHQLNYGKHI